MARLSANLGSGSVSRGRLLCPQNSSTDARRMLTKIGLQDQDFNYTLGTLIEKLFGNKAGLHVRFGQVKWEGAIFFWHYHHLTDS